MKFPFLVLFLILSGGTATAGTISLAAEDDFFPYSAEVDGELVGFVPDVALAAFDAVGVDVEFRVGPYSRALMLVKSGQIAGGFTGAIDDSNEAQFYWHETPLSSVRLAIWGRAGAGYKDLTAEDMEGRKVAITRGFFYTDAIDANEKVEKVVAPSDKSTLKMLALGRAEFALVTEKIGQAITESSNDPLLKDSLKIVGVIEEVPLYAFFSRTHPDGEKAAQLFQQGLERIIASGEYDRILKAWLP
ncbi:substrate-binding periplasmic protein [Marinobacter salicampi]|uniref:substrate-binding periplasmic protein n=1 Tax=Marinobacter salicampi TaxID=435907 RepID=UPI0014073333|nr:transporter substrate-binding domain-containing protein [Marinobacter salicampi]